MTVVSDTPPRRKVESRLLRFSDLKDRGLVANWTTLTRWVSEGQFPPGRYLGPSTRTRVWTEEEIAEWFAGRPIAKAGAA